MFIRRCQVDTKDAGNTSEFDSEETNSLTNSDDSKEETFVASYLKIFEALEEIQIESNWEPTEVSNYVLINSLNSNNPVSIYEIETFVKNSGILDKSEIDI